MFSSMVNGMIEASVKAFINAKIEKFGAVTWLEIDRDHKTIAADLALKGEAAPIWIKASSYQVSERDGQTYFTVRGLEASREWVGAVLNEYLAGREIRVPAMAAKALL
jgi:hypothetical protein